MTDGQKKALVRIAEASGAIPKDKTEATCPAITFLNTREGRMRFSTLEREGMAWFEKGVTFEENKIGLTAYGFMLYERYRDEVK